MDYEKTTEGIRVMVRPSFSLPYSEPEEGRFVFTYLVEMENQSEEVAQLLFRHWHIHDSQGEDTEVDGEGVVGEQPTLAPGGVPCVRELLRLAVSGRLHGGVLYVRPPDGRRVPGPRPKVRPPSSVDRWECF